jgi:hypothetical protein
MTPYHHYKRFCKEFYTQKKRTNITQKGWKILNLKRRTDKHSESSTESSAHTKSLNNKNN